MRYTLGFQLIDCRCGTARQRGLSCPDCGTLPDPREVDLTWADRRRTVRRARDHWAQARDLGCSFADLDSGLAAVRALLLSLDRAGSSLATGGTAFADELDHVARRAGELEAWTQGRVSLRPFVAVTRSAVAATRSVLEAAGELFSALEARSIDESQARSGPLQRSLDEGAAHLQSLNETRALVARVSASGDPISGWLGDLDNVNALSDRLALGQSIGQARTGRLVSDALGMMVALFSGVADAILDPEAFWATVRAVTLEVENNPRLAALIGSAYPVESSAAAHDLWSMGRRAALQPSAMTMREDVLDLLAQARTIFEGPLRVHLAGYLSLVLEKDYERLAADDVGVLLQHLSQLGFKEPPRFDVAFRHAAAHNDFAIEGDEVVLQPRRRSGNAPRFGLESTLDQVLAALEFAAAVQLGVAMAADHAGLEIPDEPLVPRSYLVELLLRSVGWGDVDLQVDGEEALIRAVPLRPVRASELTVALQATTADTRTALFTFTSADGRSSEVSVDVDSYRKWRLADSECEKSITYWAFSSSVRVDGEPLLGRDQIVKVAAKSAQDLALTPRGSGEPPEPRLQALRRYARSIGADDLVRAIAGLTAYRRSSLLGLPGANDELRPIVELANSNVEPLRETVFNP